jgi:hypothetical protein
MILPTVLKGMQIAVGLFIFIMKILKEAIWLGQFKSLIIKDGKTFRS